MVTIYKATQKGKGQYFVDTGEMTPAIRER